MTTFFWEIDDTPCQIRVDTYDSQPGTFSYHATDPEEYSGYKDVEYTVLDRKGYEAPGLQDKITPEEHDLILDQIDGWVEDERAEAQIYRRYG